MPPENGADLATCIASARPGRVDEFGSINDPAIAENSPHPQAADTAVRPVDPVVVVSTPAGYGKRGPLFSASVDGRTIVTASVTPFLDAARVLAGEGVDPATRIVMRHEGKDYDALTSTVGAAAKLAVKESTRDGKPRFGDWHPYGVPGVPVASPISETEPAGVDHRLDAPLLPAVGGAQ
jgi:hypothetical protein